MKYGHAEVGNILTVTGRWCSRRSSSCLSPVEDAADQLGVAKWILREVAHRRGLLVTFVPKIMVVRPALERQLHCG